MKYKSFALALASGLGILAQDVLAGTGSDSRYATVSHYRSSFYAQAGGATRLSDLDEPSGSGQSSSPSIDHRSSASDPSPAGSCGCGSCSGTDRYCCGRWLEAETLIWWTEGRSTPPLVTSGPTGVLPASSILFGNEDFQDERTGGRFTFGQWNSDDTYAIGGRFFFLETEDPAFSASSAGTPILARPFIDETGTADASIIASPGIASGRVDASSENDLMSGEIFTRSILVDACNFRIDMTGGYQWVRIDDSVLVQSFSTSLDPFAVGVPIGTTFDVFDNFQAENQFHGGQAGLLMEFYRGCWTFEALGKIGFGNMRRKIFVDGSTVVRDPGGTTTNTLVGGLLTQGTNVGQLEDDELAYIPELNLNMSYSLNDCMDIGVGYSFIYFSDVVLAGDQIDTTVNLSQQSGPLVGAARPAPQFNDTDFWAQGINFSFSYGY